MKKILWILCLIIIIVIGYFGINKYLEYREEQRIKNAIVKVELNDNLEVPFNIKIKVSDFIKSINGKITNDYLVNTSVVGDKKVTFSYINEEDILLKYSFDIKIVDNTSPIIDINSSYTVTKGYSKNLLDVIRCYDDYDDNPTCTINGEYDVNSVGNYPLTFTAKDQSGNETHKDFTLKVINKSNSSSSSSSSSIPFENLYNTYKTSNTKIGIDVSKWQYDIDFSKVKDAGVEFVFIKLGGQNGLDGDYYLDPKFERNIKGFKEVGIPIGVYFYSHANTVEKAIADALWVCKQLKDYQIDLPIVLDWENWSSYNKYHMSINTLNKMSKAFLDTIKMFGYDSMLYSSKYYLENFWNNNDYPIWLAHYTKETTYKGDYTYWQRTSQAKIDGITGNTVDFNIYYQK